MIAVAACIFGALVYIGIQASRIADAMEKRAREADEQASKFEDDLRLIEQLIDEA